MKLHNIKYYLVTIYAIIVSLAFNLLNLEKEATVSLVFLVLSSLLLYKYLYKSKEPLREMTTNKQVISIMMLFLFFFTYISQNVLLNFETIDWDVPSYLVASQDINKGNIPNQNQWESKGPMLFYLYNIFSLISSKNFVIFKLLNDLILFGISIVLFFSVTELTKKNYYKAFFSSILFLLLMSQSWAISEYSELYCLLFLSFANYLLIKNNFELRNIFIIGLSLSMSTLINQGTVMFVIPFLIIFYKKLTKEKLTKILTVFGFGLVLPHILFLIIYATQDLLNVYFATYIQIPLGYIQSNYANLYELKVFFRSYYSFLGPLYLGLVSLFLFVFIARIKDFSNISNIFFDFKYLNIILSLLFYFIGSHNYYHHLIFLLYFSSFLLIELKVNTQTLLIYSFLTISLVVFLQQNGQNAISNLKDPNKTFNEYPLKSLANEIDSYFEGDYTIFALDYLLVPYYLDKANYSYIVHPSNHFEEFIVGALSDLDIIHKNYIGNTLLYEDPDVVLCSQRMIIRGTPVKNTLYNCEVSDYRKNYFKLDTSKYVENPNLNFYRDPYKELKVFIRKDS